jgi:hypothetical protein
VCRKKSIYYKKEINDMAKASHYLKLEYLRHLKQMGLLNNGQHVDIGFPETRFPDTRLPEIKPPSQKQKKQEE